jgi:hypothetical protein
LKSLHLIVSLSKDAAWSSAFFGSLLAVRRLSRDGTADSLPVAGQAFSVVFE